MFTEHLTHVKILESHDICTRTVLHARICMLFARNHCCKELATMTELPQLVVGYLHVHCVL